MKDDFKKIKWCKSIRNGLEVVSPSNNLAKAYIKKAESALDAMLLLRKNKEWMISSCYYSMYFSLYAVMMRIGVKCENHSCSIELMRIIDKFSKEDYETLREAMKARIDSQYYSDRVVDEKKMTEYAPKFLVKCKDIISNFKEEEIKSITSQLSLL